MRRVLTIAAAVLFLVLGGLAAWLYQPDERRAGLEARYAGPPSTFVTVLGARLHVRDTGTRTAPAVLMLHGFGSSLQTWDAWAAALEGEFRVIRLDLPGFGLTGASGDYTDERGIAILAGLLDALGVERVAVVGHSMGGRIAWRFAAAYPERTAALVLISPDGFRSLGLEYGRAPAVPPLMRLLPYVLPSFMLRASLEPAYADPRTLTPALYDRYRDMMLAPGVRGAIVDRMAQQILIDPATLLPGIETPTLLLWGERDRMIPFSNAADYQRLLPHATLRAVPGVGHIPQEEAPATVEIVRAFLAGAR